MLYRNKNREWKLCEHRVKYTQHGEEVEQYVGIEGKQWWIDFTNKWKHTEIIEFIDVVANGEQIARLREVKDMPDGFGEICSKYVEFGTFPEGLNHILWPIQIIKQQYEQDNYLIDSDFRLSLLEMGVNTDDL